MARQSAANVRVSIPVRSFSIRICSTRSRTLSEQLCCVAGPDMHKDSVTRARAAHEMRACIMGGDCIMAKLNFQRASPAYVWSL